MPGLDFTRYLFAAPHAPTVPDLGPIARASGIQHGLQAFVGKAVEVAYFLGVKDGLVVGVVLGLLLGFTVGLRATGRTARA